MDWLSIQQKNKKPKNKKTKKQKNKKTKNKKTKNKKTKKTKKKIRYRDDINDNTPYWAQKKQKLEESAWSRQQRLAKQGKYGAKAAQPKKKQLGSRQRKKLAKRKALQAGPTPTASSSSSSSLNATSNQPQVSDN